MNRVHEKYQNHYTLITPYLFAGDTAPLLDPVGRAFMFYGVNCYHYISLVDVGPLDFGVSHKKLLVPDDGVLAPDEIHAALEISPDAHWVPRTYVHCQLGQNRSTAIAVCWVLRWGKHTARGYRDALGTLCDPAPEDWETILTAITKARTASLATIGRSKAEVSPQMRKNIANYADWLLSRKEA